MTSINIAPERLFETIVHVAEKTKVTNSTSLVLIDGFYGAGKTSFAKLLGSYIGSKGKESLQISTDLFMRYSRPERVSDPSRYLDHPNWYDIDKLTTSVLNILNHASLNLHDLYNHTTGERDTNLIISPEKRDYLLVEGMYACHPKLLALGGFSVMLISTHETLLRRVIVRDSIERSIPVATIKSRYGIINGQPFQMHVNNVHRSIDLVIDTSDVPKQFLVKKDAGNGSVARNFLLQS